MRWWNVSRHFGSVRIGFRFQACQQLLGSDTPMCDQRNDEVRDDLVPGESWTDCRIETP